MMNLLHYSRRPLRRVRSTTQEKTAAAKPRGLWVSAETGNGDGWADWCRAEDWHTEALAEVAEVFLSPTANILRLESPGDIDDFTAQYSDNGNSRWRWDIEIEWWRVATEYQGIIIAPYQWSRRISRAGWYYTWDCASGCLWDASAVARVERQPKARAVVAALTAESAPR